MARRRRRKFSVGSPMPKNSRISAAGAPRHSGSRCLYARAGYTVAVAVFVSIVHRAGATAEYNNGSDELLHGTTSSEGPARSTAELAVVAVVVGTKAPLSAIHRRSFPSLKAGCTVDAHIEALGRERRRLLFRPGHCSRRKAPYTAKYISLHLSYRRPGVQPSPSLSEFILDFGTCEVMNNMQYVICNGAI